MRNISSVLAGQAVTVALLITTFITLSRFMSASAWQFLGLSLVLAFVYHTFAGWLCAVIARDSRAAIVAMIVVAFAFMVQSVSNTWHSMPPWYSVLMLVIAPTAIWCGARTHSRPRAAA